MKVLLILIVLVNIHIIGEEQSETSNQMKIDRIASIEKIGLSINYSFGGDIFQIRLDKGRPLVRRMVLGSGIPVITVVDYQVDKMDDYNIEFEHIIKNYNSASPFKFRFEKFKIIIDKSLSIKLLVNNESYDVISFVKNMDEYEDISKYKFITQ